MRVISDPIDRTDHVCPGVLTACGRDEISTCTGGSDRRNKDSFPPLDPDEFDEFCLLVNIRSVMHSARGKLN